MGSASSSYRVIYLDVDGRIQKVGLSVTCTDPLKSPVLIHNILISINAFSQEKAGDSG